MLITNILKTTYVLFCYGDEGYLKYNWLLRLAASQYLKNLSWQSAIVFHGKTIWKKLFM